MFVPCFVYVFVHLEKESVGHPPIFTNLSFIYTARGYKGENRVREREGIQTGKGHKERSGGGEEEGVGFIFTTCTAPWNRTEQVCVSQKLRSTKILLIPM